MDDNYRHFLLFSPINPLINPVNQMIFHDKVIFINIISLINMNKKKRTGYIKEIRQPGC